MEKKAKQIEKCEEVKQVKLTKEEIIQIANLLRTIKAWFTLSKEGALAFMKNTISFGKVTKEVDEVIKVYIDAIRTPDFIKESENVEKLKAKSAEEQTDDDKNIINVFDEKIKKLDLEINDLKIKLLKESVDIEINYFSFNDLYEIMKQKENKDINGYNYEILYETFIK